MERGRMKACCPHGICRRGRFRHDQAASQAAFSEHAGRHHPHPLRPRNRGSVGEGAGQIVDMQ